MKRILLSNKILLGVLCIAIGMVPFLGVLNTVESGKAMLSKEFNRAGKKLLSVKLNGAAVTYEDFKKLGKEMPEIKTMIPIVKTTTTLSSYKTNSMVELKAVGSDYWRYSALKMLKGKFINKGHLENYQNVIVLDDLTADTLFGTTDVLGRNLEVSIDGRDIEAVVIGVSKRMDISGEKLDQKQGIAYIPITTLDNNSERYSIDEALLLVNIHMEEAKARILHYFSSIGVEEPLIEVNYINQVGVIKAIFEANKKMLLASAILWFFAVIVGLTNIMLVDIEQTKMYYGLLKFYGNTERQIMKLIFSKALIMGAAGSIFCIFIGLIASFVICNVLNIPIFISIHTITLGILIPEIVCLAAAVYPAIRATRIDLDKVVWQ